MRTDLPFRVREIEHAWIPLADGTRLAARGWLPEGAEADPVPAVFEYLPYRKNDGTALRDSVRHPYLAGHGYASVRVDMRGSGDSDGILEDEYLPREQDDALEVLRWLAAQPWCTGDVGMFGISWGGFNALQVAARRPPELKAVVSLCSTDDRYADDVHYMGGCVLGDLMLSWASSMLAFNARPPDPRVVGEGWRAQWLDRMAKSPPFIEAWLSHQRRDAYWQHGSVCEDFSAVECPVYVAAGWVDAYRSPVLRLLEGLSCPRKGLLGPWGHAYPEQGAPGPAIGFMQECVRWWDHWLKGIDTGIMDEPMLRSWIQEWIEPRTSYSLRPGRWVADPGWPSPNVAMQARALAGDGTIAPEAGSEERLELRSPQLTGIDSGRWNTHGRGPDLPADQRAEDGRSLTFTSEPLAERIEILGFPEVVLALASDRPLALVAVRLCDVGPGGASLLVAQGLLNLTHLADHEHPAPLEPDRRYEARVRLKAIGHAFETGHRIRVGVSTAYWPWAWPSPEPVTLTVFAGPGCRLELPVRSPRAADGSLPAFLEPEGAPPLVVEPVGSGGRSPEHVHDRVRDRHVLTLASDRRGYRRPDDGYEYVQASLDRFEIVEGEPLSATVRSERQIVIARGAWRTRVETVSSMTADATAFHVTNVLEAYEDDVRVFAKTWAHRIPRDLV